MKAKQMDIRLARREAYVDLLRVLVRLNNHHQTRFTAYLVEMAIMDLHEIERGSEAGPN